MNNPLYLYFERQGLLFIGSCALTLLMAIGTIDYNLGPTISTSLFYIFPVALAAWFAGRGPGLSMAVLAALVWAVTDWGAGMNYDHVLIGVWNSLMRFAIFALVAWLVSTLRSALRTVEVAADTDPLTGLLNRRGFNEALDIEYARSARSGLPLSLVYIDVDNFKQVNDTQGHDAGDRVLSTIAQQLAHNLRRIDRTGRLGGDEFIILLPESDSHDARRAITHCARELTSRMRTDHWPVTFSIGVISFERLPENAEQTIRLADELMYQSKKAGKDRITYQVWNG